MYARVSGFCAPARQILSAMPQMVSKTKPKAVVVNMIYYLDERPGGSWADPVLQRLG